MSGAASAAPRRDGSWRRFPALLAAALPLTTLGFLVLARLLQAPPPRPIPPVTIAAELVELMPPPAPPRVRDDAPALPDAPADHPPPAPEAPPPVPEDEPPPPPAPPLAEQAPPPPPPRAKPPPPRSTTAPPRPEAAPAASAPPTSSPSASPPPTSVAPASPAPSPAGDRMGARAIFQPKPEIPEALRHRALSAVATVRFHVAADGTATVELLQATGDPDLNKAIIDALRRWRFFPAMQEGRPVASALELRLPIEIR